MATRPKNYKYDDGSLHDKYVKKIIPILVYWAQTSWDKPHYYSDVTKLTGIHWRQVGELLGTIWSHVIQPRFDDAPPLNFLVCSKGKDLPSGGVDYVKPEYSSAPKDKQADYARSENLRAHNYDWIPVLKALGLKPFNPETIAHTYWILPWNPKKFNLIGCLEEFGFVEWRQINKLAIGDYVFLYCTKPVGQILYMFQVTKAEIPYDDTINDQFFETDEWDIPTTDIYARFKPISVVTLGNKALSHETLVSKGMKTNLQMGMRATGILLDHILQNFNVAIDESSGEYHEGASHQTTVTSYERNPFARQKCLEKYGYACQICGLKFEDKYGEVGKDFIHVHHIEFIASKGGKSHKVDPIKDLIPVCPNCHAMLHRKINGKYVTPSELKCKIKK